MRINKKFLLLGFFLINYFLLMADPAADIGKGLFQNRCSSCHNVNKDVVGPALAGVSGRHNIDWIVNFVHSSQTVIKSGDTSANTLFAKFNKTPMPDHPDLTKENISNILAFIQQEEKNKPTNSAPFEKPSIRHYNYLPISWAEDNIFLITYIFGVLTIITALFYKVSVNDYKRKINQ